MSADCNARRSIVESEGKSCATNTLAEDQSMNEGFSEVYDWRPSVEKTDVMRTMEAIEGVYFCFLLNENYMRNTAIAKIRYLSILFFYTVIRLTMFFFVPRSPTALVPGQVALAKVELKRTK